jgi:ribosome recycling factor
LLQLGAAVVKAIRDSPLSLNPTNEGNEVLVKLPRLTKDTIGTAVIVIQVALGV